MLWEKESLETDAAFIDICARRGGGSIFQMLDEMSDSKPKTIEKSSKLSNHYRTKGMHQSESANWFEAIELFNQALCFAEKGSRDMGCVYADRAACFFNLKMYENCMVDIKLAKLNNCPVNFLPKLKKWNENCKKMLQTSTEVSNVPVFKPELSYEANESCPSLANVVQIEKHESNDIPSFSRHITANSDIDVGKTIMIEDGFVCSTTEIYKRCCICLKMDTNLVPCAKCTDSLVCYGTCEKSHWHKIECSIDLHTTTGSSSGRGSSDNNNNEKDKNNNSSSVSIDDYAVVRSILTALRIIPNVSELMRFVDRIVSNRDSELACSISTQLSQYTVFLENGLKAMQKWPKKDRKTHFL